MNDSRKVGVMIDSGPIQSNLTHMCDAIRNANYKVLDQQGMQPNEEGEYLDKEGENLLMDEDAVKVLLQDAIDSYLVATLPGKNKADPNEFTYYLWDSFPNVAEYIQAEPRISSYVSALFAKTCGMLVNSLTPAINDIQSHGQNLEHIETFLQGPNTSYYILVGEDAIAEEDTSPEHQIPRMSKQERAEQTKIALIKELGVEGYEAWKTKEHNRAVAAEMPDSVKASLDDHDGFQDYIGALNKALEEMPEHERLAIMGKHQRKLGGFGRYYIDGGSMEDVIERVKKREAETNTRVSVSWKPDVNDPNVKIGTVEYTEITPGELLPPVHSTPAISVSHEPATLF